VAERAPYRSPSSIAPEPPDPEVLAFSEIARRAKRIRLTVMLPVLLSGIGLGVAAYVGLRELFFETVGVHYPYLTGLLTVSPTVALAWKTASVLARGLIARRTHAWVADLAERHELAREPLEDFARAL
jgi:hypothetical protein